MSSITIDTLNVKWNIIFAFSNWSIWLAQHSDKYGIAHHATSVDLVASTTKKL